MKKVFYLLFIGLIVFGSCKTDDDVQEMMQEEEEMEEEEEEEEMAVTELALLDYFQFLTFNQPLDIQSPPDGSNRLFVVEKTGRIQVFPVEETATDLTFLDLSGNLHTNGEMGLLGLAFHPQYDLNGYFYVYYNPNNTTSRISRFTVEFGDINAADPNSEFVLMEFNQPATNHNGGQLNFGPDGYLYISSGDGGPSIHGQDLDNLLGGILRIDVDNASGGLNYAIPADNPFVGVPGAREELFAYGLRNPWRTSFDTLTGKLWAGDVGSGNFEEVNIIESGENYGWHDYEGNNCRLNPCLNQNVVFPFHTYPRAQTGSAITGGYVYRGTLNPELENQYVYADFVDGFIWTLDINSAANELLYDTNFKISGFGTDENEELYVCDLQGGKIYKFGRVEVIGSNN